MHNTSGLRRGGPGRPKGSVNKANADVRMWAQSILEHPAVRAKTLELARQGKLDASLFRELLHYAYGKPKDTVSVDGAVQFSWRQPEDENGE